jgi:hypothetical protein
VDGMSWLPFSPAIHVKSQTQEKGRPLAFHQAIPQPYKANSFPLHLMIAGATLQECYTKMELRNMSQAAIEAVKMLAQREKREIELQKFFDKIRKQQLVELRVNGQIGRVSRKVLRKSKDQDSQLSVRLVTLPENDFGVKFEEEENRIKKEVQAVLSNLSRGGSRGLSPTPTPNLNAILPMIKVQPVKPVSKSPRNNSKDTIEPVKVDSEREGWDSWRHRLEHPSRLNVGSIRTPKIRPYKTKTPSGNPTDIEKDGESRYYNEVVKKRRLNLAFERKLALNSLSANHNLSVDARRVQPSVSSQSQQQERSIPRAHSHAHNSNSVDRDGHSKDSIGNRTLDPYLSSKISIEPNLNSEPSIINQREMFHRYIDDLHKNALKYHQKRENEYLYMEKVSKDTTATRSTRSRELIVTTKLNLDWDSRHAQVIHDYSFQRISPRVPNQHKKSRNLHERDDKRKTFLEPSSEIKIYTDEKLALTQDNNKQKRSKLEPKSHLRTLDKVNNSSADRIHSRMLPKLATQNIGAKDYLKLSLNSWRVGTPPDLDSPR